MRLLANSSLVYLPCIHCRPVEHSNLISIFDLTVAVSESDISAKFEDRFFCLLVSRRILCMSFVKPFEEQEPLDQSWSLCDLYRDAFKLQARKRWRAESTETAGCVKLFFSTSFPFHFSLQSRGPCTLRRGVFQTGSGVVHTWALIDATQFWWLYNILQNADLHARQWLKCNGTQENAILPPPIYDSNRSPTSDCYNTRERHTTIVGGPNLNVAFPYL